MFVFARSSSTPPSFFYGRRPGQPSSSSLARRVCVHFEYVFADAQNYVKAPGSSCRAEGRWRDSAAGGHRSFCGPVCSQSAPCNLMFFSLKDVFKNLPIWAAAMVAGALHGQLRTSNVAGWCLDLVASEDEEPTEGIGVSVLGDKITWFGPRGFRRE